MFLPLSFSFSSRLTLGPLSRPSQEACRLPHAEPSRQAEAGEKVHGGAERHRGRVSCTGAASHRHGHTRTEVKDRDWYVCSCAWTNMFLQVNQGCLLLFKVSLMSFELIISYDK